MKIRKLNINILLIYLINQMLICLILHHRRSGSADVGLFLIHYRLLDKNAIHPSVIHTCKHSLYIPIELRESFLSSSVYIPNHNVYV